MDVTEKCSITAKHGFDSITSNRFAVIKVKAKYGDLIRVNDINGIRYKEIWGAYENPRHEDTPIIDTEKIVIIVGGKQDISQRIICVIGK